MAHKSTVDFLAENFDVSEGEAQVYVKLVELQNSTVLGLSKATGLNRITVHGYVESLIEKGLISQSKRGARRRLVAESPDRLEEMLEKKKKEVREIENNLPYVIQKIAELSPEDGEKAKAKVKVKYYEGKKAVFQLYRDSIKADEVYSFAHLERYYEIFPDTIDLWEKALKENPKREVWDILLDSPLDREIGIEGKYPRYHVKLLPKSDHFSGFKFTDYLIYDDKVAIIQLDPKDLTAILLQSKHIAASLKGLHQSLWDLLPKERTKVN